MHGEYAAGEVAAGESAAWSSGAITGPSTAVLDAFNRATLDSGWTANQFGAAGGGAGSTEFADGFESGDTSAWSGLINSGTGSTTVVSGGAYAGTYRFRSTNTGATNARQQAYKDFSFPANNKAYCRFYFYINSLTGDGTLRLGGLYKESPVFNSVIGFEWTGGVWQVRVRLKDGTTVSVNMTSSPGTGSWQEFECAYDNSGANPVATWWLNGTLDGTYTDTSSGTAPTPERVNVGVHETSWTASGDIYYDAVRVSDDRIGGGLSAPVIDTNKLTGAAATESNGWLNAASYSGDVDAYATVPTMPPAGEYAALTMLVSPGASTTDAYQLRLTHAGTLTLYRITDGAIAATLGEWVTGLGAGDRLWLRRNTSTGVLQVAYKLGAGGWYLAGAASDATHTGAVFLGANFTGTTAQIDDLGGGESVGGTPTYTGDIVATVPTPDAVVDASHTPPTYAGLIDAVAPTPAADLSGAHTPPTYSGDVAAFAPTPTADITGSYAQPLYTADIAATAPLPSADLTGAHVPPTYAGDIVATAPTPSADAVGAFTPALYTADISATVPTPVADVSGAHVPPVYAGDVAAIAPLPGADLTGAHATPVYTADIVATAPLPGATLVGDQLPPVYVASADGLLPLPVAEMTGTFAGELYSAVIEATVPTPSAEVIAFFTQPVYAALIVVTAPLPTADIAGSHTPPVYAGDIAATAPTPSADAVGTFAGSLYSGEITATVPLPVVVVTGAHVPPAYAGDIAANAQLPSAVVDAAFVAPVYSADIAVVLPLPDAMASGLFVAPTYVGDIVATAPTPTAEMTGGYSTFVAPLVVRITRKMLARFMAKRMPV